MTPSIGALPLGSLRGFAAAVRTESFTLAARELHLTHGAVSRQIRALEEATGVVLFERRNRRVVPTRAALALHRHVALALDTLTAGLAEVRRENEGPLVVSCEPTLTRQWLIPRLSRKSPAMTLDVSVAGGLPAFGAAGVDVAIRRADFAWPATVHATPLMDEWMGPVCHPSIARSSRKVARVHTRTRPRAWEAWEASEARPTTRVSSASNVTFDHFWLSLEAAASGLGYAMAPYPLVERELREGRLAAPFGFVRGDEGYVVLTTERRDPRVDRLVGWLVREARAMDRAMPASLRNERSSPKKAVRA